MKLENQAKKLAKEMKNLRTLIKLVEKNSNVLSKKRITKISNC